MVYDKLTIREEELIKGILLEIARTDEGKVALLAFLREQEAKEQAQKTGGSR